MPMMYDSNTLFHTYLTLQDGQLAQTESVHLTLLERTLAVDICLSACPSVRPSVKRVDCTKRNNSLSIYQCCTTEGFF